MSGCMYSVVVKVWGGGEGLWCVVIDVVCGV